jgi:hypothetical protein
MSFFVNRLYFCIKAKNGHAELTGQMKNANKILVGKFEAQTLFKEIRFHYADWTEHNGRFMRTRK